MIPRLARWYTAWRNPIMRHPTLRSGRRSLTPGLLYSMTVPPRAIHTFKNASETEPAEFFMTATPGMCPAHDSPAKLADPSSLEPCADVASLFQDITWIVSIFASIGGSLTHPMTDVAPLALLPLSAHDSSHILVYSNTGRTADMARFPNHEPGRHLGREVYPCPDPAHHGALRDVPPGRGVGAVRHCVHVYPHTSSTYCREGERPAWSEETSDEWSRRRHVLYGISGTFGYLRGSSYILELFSAASILCAIF